MLNTVSLIGRLGADPEIRYTQDGAMVANIRIATDEQWKDKNGEKVQKTEWHRCVAFGKLAEIIGKYCVKGRLVYVQGRIQTRKWTDKEGADRYITEIIALTLKLLDKAANSSGASAPANGGAPPAAQDDVQTDYDPDIPF
jgi:single-strand DNA-binding protein